MKRELLASDLPEDPYLQTELDAYFPHQLREQFGCADRRASAAAGDHHHLRREQHRQQRGHDLRVPTVRRNWCDNRRAGARTHRCPRRLRHADAVERHRGTRQQRSTPLSRREWSSSAGPSSNAALAGWSTTAGRRSTSPRRSSSSAPAWPRSSNRCQPCSSDTISSSSKPARHAARAGGSGSTGCPGVVHAARVRRDVDRRHSDKPRA